jgi:hypothetical protein
MSSTDSLLNVLIQQSTMSDPMHYARVCALIRNEDFRNKVHELRLAMDGLRDIATNQAELFADLGKNLRGDGAFRRTKRKNKREMTIEELLGGGGADSQGSAIADGPNLIDMFGEISNGQKAIVESAYAGTRLIASVNLISLDEAEQKTETDLKNVGVKDTVATALLQKIKNNRKDALSELAAEQQLNRGATTALVRGVDHIANAVSSYVNLLANMTTYYSNYYHAMKERHQVDGVIIISDLEARPSVTLTDLAITVWHHIDRMGEIENGAKEDEISLYTVQRIQDLMTALRDKELRDELLDPRGFILKTADLLHAVVTSCLEITTMAMEAMDSDTHNLERLDLEQHRKNLVSSLDYMRLDSITRKPSNVIMSKAELFAKEHEEKGIQAAAQEILLGSSAQEAARFLIVRKIEERKFLYDVNSFFVCKIGNGNSFTGVAPGALEVIPGQKPSASLDHIWGSGFDELRDYVAGVKEAEEWHELFLATSPSGTTDKNNVLLVGPMGCGKTQVMRSIGSMTDSIAIFAVGSDFLTCWMGEAQKNPKRLFEAALKIRNQSRKHVHILIDEIDMVLNNDGDLSRRVDLALEFQNLMDGVVSYPGLTIWGATNHPGRIPPAMLRRFAKVMIVGEQSEEDRIRTLRHYIENFMPVSGALSDYYVQWADELKGATGDVIRKCVDDVWLRFMRDYRRTHADHARQARDLVKGTNIADLSDQARINLKKHIAEKAVVEPALVSASIKNVLSNHAVRHQIEVAVHTYKTAHQMFQDRL